MNPCIFFHFRKVFKESVLDRQDRIGINYTIFCIRSKSAQCDIINTESDLLLYL